MLRGEEIEAAAAAVVGRIILSPFPFDVNKIKTKEIQMIWEKTCSSSCANDKHRGDVSISTRIRIIIVNTFMRVHTRAIARNIVILLREDFSRLLGSTSIIGRTRNLYEMDGPRRRYTYCTAIVRLQMQTFHLTKQPREERRKFVRHICNAL